MTEIITLTISKELRDKIDLKRGDIPRSKFISRSLEAFFKDRGQSEDQTQSNSKVLDKQVLTLRPINCEICTDNHRNIQNSNYCRCKCHKNKSQMSESVGGSFSDTIGSSSFQEESQNDYRH
jgi:hypothetical protein